MLKNPFTASCHETGEQMSDYVEGELRGLARLRVARHLARCERCQAVYRSLLKTLEALRGLGSIEPPAQPALADAVVDRIRNEPRSP
jgi:anti-sigma factor RsiW